MEKKTEEIVIDCDLLLILDSNGKYIREDRLSRDIIANKVWGPTLEIAIKTLEKAEFKRIPSSILINVGLNDMDTSTIETTKSNYNKLHNLLRRIAPESTIHYNSIILRRDKKFTNEIKYINMFSDEFSDI